MSTRSRSVTKPMDRSPKRPISHPRKASNTKSRKANAIRGRSSSSTKENNNTKVINTNDPCICGPDFYTNVLGPTADETILVGLQTFLGLCNECPPDEVLELLRNKSSHESESIAIEKSVEEKQAKYSYLEDEDDEDQEEQILEIEKGKEHAQSESLTTIDGKAQTSEKSKTNRQLQAVADTASQHGSSQTDEVFIENEILQTGHLLETDGSQTSQSYISNAASQTQQPVLKNESSQLTQSYQTSFSQVLKSESKISKSDNFETNANNLSEDRSSRNYENLDNKFYDKSTDDDSQKNGELQKRYSEKVQFNKSYLENRKEYQYDVYDKVRDHTSEKRALSQIEKSQTDQINTFHNASNGTLQNNFQGKTDELHSQQSTHSVEDTIDKDVFDFEDNNKKNSSNDPSQKKNNLRLSQDSHQNKSNQYQQPLDHHFQKVIELRTSPDSHESNFDQTDYQSNRNGRGSQNSHQNNSNVKNKESQYIDSHELHEPSYISQKGETLHIEKSDTPKTSIKNSKSQSSKSILKHDSSSSKSTKDSSDTCNCCICTETDEITCEPCFEHKCILSNIRTELCSCSSCKIKPKPKSVTRKSCVRINTKCVCIDGDNNTTVTSKRTSTDSKTVRQKRQAPIYCDCYTSTSSTGYDTGNYIDEAEDDRPSETGDVGEVRVRYAITKITKFSNYTTFEVMKSTRKQPKTMPKSLEGVFVLKNCIKNT